MNKAHEILFEYEIGKWQLRCLKNKKGCLEVQKKKISSKKFRTICWGGSIEKHREVYLSNWYKEILATKK